jgi:hypothetical protein
MPEVAAFGVLRYQLDRLLCPARPQAGEGPTS